MDPITIQAGDIVATCQTVEQAAALVRALQGAPLAPAAEPIEKRPRRGGRRKAKEEAAAPQTVGRSGRGEIKARILSFVAKHPVVRLAELASHLYGDTSSAARGRAGVSLRTLVVRGSLKKLPSGEYQVR